MRKVARFALSVLGALFVVHFLDDTSQKVVLLTLVIEANWMVTND